MSASYSVSGRTPVADRAVYLFGERPCSYDPCEKMCVYDMISACGSPEGYVSFRDRTGQGRMAVHSPCMVNPDTMVLLLGNYVIVGVVDLEEVEEMMWRT
ncbi:hypothetical protein KIPB_003628 [Kipferlia bialata]|uniref:Uncharacterized protein n=1 Tax=Kipferlia bialata TaxID=797122 RepID=A0A391NQD1_9EUKA|nr:hypothetical protein KIPB_003628 [Kipferlia bialata]|eukprot:g3628.t1